MAVELFTALIKARYGNVYEFKKYRKISRSEIKSFVIWANKTYDVAIIFFYDKATKKYVGYWTKKGFFLP